MFLCNADNSAGGATNCLDDFAVVAAVIGERPSTVRDCAGREEINVLPFLCLTENSAGATNCLDFAVIGERPSSAVRDRAGREGINVLPIIICLFVFVCLFFLFKNKTDGIGRLQ